MKTVFFVLLIILFVVLVFKLATRKYNCPYKLIMMFGRKGVGKSTTLCKLALKYHKKGWTVYSTEYTPFSYHIDPSEIGFVQLEPHSVLLVDEVGMIWDNRNFKNFRPEVRDFFKLQRHYKVRCYLFSQTWEDSDKKIRDLVDQMYLLVNVGGVFSYGKRIIKRFVLTQSTSMAPSTIAEDLKFDSFLLFWAGSRIFTYIPKYAKYFDSFYAPQLSEKVFEYVEPKNKKLKKKTRSFEILNRLFGRFRRRRRK